MSDIPKPGIPSFPEVQARLHAAAQMLRASPSLDLAVRDALAELLDELSRVLKAPAAPPAEVARLAEGAAHLADALHHQHDRGRLEEVRDRLKGLAIEAEARAPTAVSLVHSLIDALAGLGI